jgi:hypothetical protein
VSPSSSNFASTCICNLLDAFPTGLDHATPSSPMHLGKPYSPECAEVEFCELRLYGRGDSRAGVLGALVRRLTQRPLPRVRLPASNMTGTLLGREKAELYQWGPAKINTLLLSLFAYSFPCTVCKTSSALLKVSLLELLT